MQRVANIDAAGLKQSQGRPRSNARKLLRASADSSSSKPASVPKENAEQAAQSGLKADITGALSDSDPASKLNAGDRR